MLSVSLVTLLPDCPVIFQDKMVYIKAVPEICVPSLSLPIIVGGPTPEGIAQIRMFVERYKYLYSSFSEINFVVKLPFVTAKKPSYCRGVDGIIKAVTMYSKVYTRNNPSGFLGYIPYVIIQPRYFIKSFIHKNSFELNRLIQL